MWREDGRGGAGRPDQLHLGQRQGAFTRYKDISEEGDEAVLTKT